MAVHTDTEVTDAEAARLSELNEVDWLVDARHEIQTLLVQLYRRWDELEKSKRELAAGAAVSLWHAVFLLSAKEANPSIPPGGRVFDKSQSDAAARELIFEVVRTNTTDFIADSRHAQWTARFFTDNAVYRIGELRSEARPQTASTRVTLKEAWDQALEELQRFVANTAGNPEL